jgi:hypothetical protein
MGICERFGMTSLQPAQADVLRRIQDDRFEVRAYR